jgi:hypothetical protein
VATAPSQIRPGVSVTRATLVRGTPEPGRKSIAHGESKVATALVVNGRSELGCAVVEVPHEARLNSIAT